MRFSILALGSRGDVQPFVALGHGLQAAGHRVRIASFESFAPLVTQHGLNFYPVKGDAEALTASLFDENILQTRNPLKLAQAIRATYAALIADYLEAFTDSAFADSDVIVNQLPAGLFGGEIAEKYGIPYLQAAVIPMVPTRFHALPLLTTQHFGAVLNRASYTLADFLVRRVMFADAVKQMRQKLGLSKTPPHRASPVPIIHGFSPRVVPPPPDWGSHVHTTSWWIAPYQDWTPPADLVEFIGAGDAPIFIGFGSMSVKDRDAFTRMLIDAVKAAGVRAVLSRGWAHLGGDLPDTIYALDYAPFEWLFPQMAAVIHHGGSGTTGTALRSGVPSMVIPFIADQPYWGMRTAALGVGVPSIMVKSLTADKLAAAIKTLISDPVLARRAAALGEALRAEDGIGMAVEAIERCIR